MKLNQQEKCEWAKKILLKHVRPGGSVCKCLNCYKARKILNAPSPHQEAWAERFDRVLRKHREWGRQAYLDIQAFIRQELTTLHKADCERFRGMIGEDEPLIDAIDKMKKTYDQTDVISDADVFSRNRLRAELRTALKTFEDGKMNDTDILKKAIEKAVKNGFNKDFPIDLFLKLQEAWYGVIFSHDFAKAFWGTKETYKREHGYYEAGNVPKTEFIEETINSGWQFHLQQMVLEENPIQYLAQYL